MILYKLRALVLVAGWLYSLWMHWTNNIKLHSAAYYEGDAWSTGYKLKRRVRHTFLEILYSYILRVVGIATRYGLDGPAIESRWGAETSRTSPGAPSIFLYNGHGISFPGVKQLQRDAEHIPASNAEVKERVGLKLYSPSGPSRPVLGWTLSFCTVSEKVRACFSG